MNILSFVLAIVSLTGAAEEAGPSHTIHVDERLLTPEDGLLLGNGDLSVSVYQTADRIIFRFGKNDVWDRRLDLSDDPKPAHIDEITNGIEKEGWKCPPYGGGPVVATKGTQNPERMKELCVGAPPSYTRRPYPCPKPVGELALQLPPDLMGMDITQDLAIEEAILRVHCVWPSSVAVDITAFIPPAPNVLVVRWTLSNWNDNTRMGTSNPPVWFSLYRWADPTIQAFGAKFFGDYRHDTFAVSSSPKVTPLPPPTVQQTDGLFSIQQTFPTDPTFPDGFRYLMTPLANGIPVQHVNMDAVGEARVHLLPPADMTDGALAVAVTTSSDPGGPAEELSRVAGTFKEKPDEAVAKWESDTKEAAKAFWSRSSLRVEDTVLENLWYETLHARRCTTRAGIAPPGLMLPSTVQDYSHWHGDYHTNYNIQEPFWGDYTANHFEVGDAYFKAMEYFFHIGRKIAKDYYNCRGVFVQLSGYPIVAQDDPLGCVPMGRMAYMTGWAINQYWWRYKYSMDTDWLRNTGYPAIREAALFCTDFLKKGADGRYHAFPSNQGEDGFTGNAQDYTDRPQVMQHIRYCLRVAIQAAEILGADEDLRAQWRERLDLCAGDDSKPPLDLKGIEKICQEANPPEFGFGRPYRRQPEKAEGTPWPPPGDASATWYLGQYPWYVMQRLRCGDFCAALDVPVFRKIVQGWRHPNGLYWGMAIGNYGHAGAWTESLGVNAPLQEMMLQSWDGALRIFPAWPRDIDARFERFRAEGAFLVSASSVDGEVKDLEVFSEKGGTCRFYNPWTSNVAVTGPQGQAIEVKDQEGILSFDTTAGATYQVSRPVP